MSNSKKVEWRMDFTCKKRRSNDLPSPPGYNPSVSQAVETIRSTENNILVKRSWDMALSPLKQLPMNMFMMYMAGESISIFPLMMIAMMVLRNVKTLFGIQATFQLISGRHSILQRFIYLLGVLANLAVAVYKCQSLGLLPTHASDWLAFVEPQRPLQLAVGGMAVSATSL